MTSASWVSRTRSSRPPAPEPVRRLYTVSIVRLRDGVLYEREVTGLRTRRYIDVLLACGFTVRAQVTEAT